MFISLEGTEGSGKTTQARRLVDRLRGAGHDVMLVHEPGGTSLGERVRPILLESASLSIQPTAEALLFAACRSQIVTEVIRPALARGMIVVADRFSDSTRAYQGGGRGLPDSLVEQLIQWATGGLEPDLTLLLEVAPTAGIARRRDGAAAEWTRFEAEDLSFHERVHAAYVSLANRDPRRWTVVNGEESLEEVESAVWAAVSPRFTEHPLGEPGAARPA